MTLQGAVIRPIITVIAMILWADERYILGEDVSYVNLSLVYDGVNASIMLKMCQDLCFAVSILGLVKMETYSH